MMRSDTSPYKNSKGEGKRDSNILLLLMIFNNNKQIDFDNKGERERERLTFTQHYCVCMFVDHHFPVNVLV